MSWRRYNEYLCREMINRLYEYLDENLAMVTVKIDGEKFFLFRDDIKIRRFKSVLEIKTRIPLRKLGDKLYTYVVVAMYLYGGKLFWREEFHIHWLIDDGLKKLKKWITLSVKYRCKGFSYEPHLKISW